MKRTVKSIRGWMAAPVLILAASLTLAVSGAGAADDGDGVLRRGRLCGKDGKTQRRNDAK